MKIKKILRDLVMSIWALGSLIAAFTFSLLGVWWLPQMIEFLEINSMSNITLMKILLPIGVFFMGINFMFIFYYLSRRI